MEHLCLYAHFSSHFSQPLLMAEIWYLVTSFIKVPHIVGSVFGPIRFLLPVCWFLYTFNIHLYMHIFLSNYWWQESDIWSQASYRYAIMWEAFLDPSDSYFLFADLVGFYTHWTYMHIFRHIFLSNYWWQRSDICSQALYRYPISWEAYTFNIHLYMHIFLSNYWWQESDIWSQASYRYAIMWEAFLDPSDSYFLFADLVGFYTHWTYMHIFRHIFLSNYWWQRSDICSQALYRYPISWEAFLDPSDSYFLFADFYTHLTYICICTFF